MRVLIVLFWLLAAVSASADEVITTTKANEIMPGFSQTQSLSGEFRQQRKIEVLKLPLISSGTFHYQQNKGILWQTLIPVHNIIQIDSQQGLLAGTDSDNLKPVTTPQLIADLFLAVFSGNLERLSTLFTIDTATAKQGWQLHLTPRSHSMQSHLTSIDLQGSEHIQSIVFEEANGDLTQIHLFNISNE